MCDFGYCATGVIQASRSGNCPLLSVKSMDKNSRGFYEYQSDVGHIASLVRCRDNKSVKCITIKYDHGIEESSCIRYSREIKAKNAVIQPKLTANFNKGKGDKNNVVADFCVFSKCMIVAEKISSERQKCSN